MERQLIDEYLDARNGMAETTKYKTRIFLNKLFDYGESIGKEPQQFEKQDFIELFRLANRSSKRSGFDEGKVYIRNFFTWYAAHTPNDLASQLSLEDEDKGVSALNDMESSDIDASMKYLTYYFADEDEFVATLKSIDKDGYERNKALAILSWLGFERKSALDIKRSEVDRKNHTVQGKIVENDYLFSIIQFVADSDTVRVQKDGDISKGGYEYTVTLSDGDLLFRKSAANIANIPDIHISEARAVQMIQDLNLYLKDNRLDKTPKQFKATILMNNALYCKLHKFEQETGKRFNAASVENARLLKEYFGISKNPSQMQRLVTQYMDWKNFFFQNE